MDEWMHGCMDETFKNHQVTKAKTRIIYFHAPTLWILFFKIYILFGLLSRFIYRNGSAFLHMVTESTIWSAFVVVSGPKTDSFRILFVPKRKIPRVQNNLFIWHNNRTPFTLFLYLKGKRVSVSNSHSVQYVLFRNNF
jgi:hypothetical protein